MSFFIAKSLRYREKICLFSDKAYLYDLKNPNGYMWTSNSTIAKVYLTEDDAKKDYQRVVDWDWDYIEEKERTPISKYCIMKDIEASLWQIMTE